MTNERPQITIGTTLYKTYSWKPYTVTGETSRSWLVRCEEQASWEPDTKIPKCKLPEGWTLNRQDWEDWKFATQYRWRIKDAVERATPARLRAIADLLGWTPQPEQQAL